MSGRVSSMFSRTNILAFAILAVTCVWLAWWFYQRSLYVYLDDARVASTMINISSRIPGWVVDLPVDEGQQVNKGDTLVSIDNRDTRLQLDETEARLRKTVGNCPDPTTGRCRDYDGTFQPRRGGIGDA